MSERQYYAEVVYRDSTPLLVIMDRDRSAQFTARGLDEADFLRMADAINGVPIVAADPKPKPRLFDGWDWPSFHVGILSGIWIGFLILGIGGWR